MRWISPPMRSPTRSASGWMTISSFRSLTFSCSTAEDCAGSDSSITDNRVNTAVDSRNGTRTTITLMNAVTSSAAVAFRKRRRAMIDLPRAGRVGLDALHQVQEADLGLFEAVDDLARAGLQERVDQQERDRDRQRERGVVHRDRD